MSRRARAPAGSVGMSRRARAWRDRLPGVAAVAAAAASALLGACTSPEGPSGPLVELLERDAWTESTADNDPIPTHRPAITGCPAAAWITERTALELSTDYCDYISITSPSLLDLQPGDTIELEAFYFDLTSPDATTGHWALVIGDEVIWEVSPAIPGPAMFFEETLTVSKAHPAGTAVTVHLHNHGQNSYGLTRLELP